MKIEFKGQEETQEEVAQDKMLQIKLYNTGLLVGKLLGGGGGGRQQQPQQQQQQQKLRYQFTYVNNYNYASGYYASGTWNHGR